MNNTLTTLFSILLLVLFTCGCAPSNRPPGLPDLHPASITITQEGKPASDVSIRLVPKIPSEWSVSSTTNASGTAKLVTYGQFDGAPAGEYTVVLSKRVTEEIAAARDEYSSASADIYELIAAEYTKPETSTLEITIEKKRNTQTFEIGAPVRVLVDTIRPGT